MNDKPKMLMPDEETQRLTKATIAKLREEKGDAFVNLVVMMGRFEELLRMIQTLEGEHHEFTMRYATNVLQEAMAFIHEGTQAVTGERIDVEEIQTTNQDIRTLIEADALRRMDPTNMDSRANIAGNSTLQ